jgi:hypothetical protein
MNRHTIQMVDSFEGLRKRYERAVPVFDSERLYVAAIATTTNPGSTTRGQQLDDGATQDANNHRM